MCQILYNQLHRKYISISQLELDTNNFYFISHLHQVNSVVKIYMHTFLTMYHIIFEKQYLQLVMPTCCSGDS